MNEELLNKIYKLKEDIECDERIITLNKLEQEMNNDGEVLLLVNQKNIAEAEYSDALNHYSEGSKELEEKQHNLFIKKKELESHPKVRAYLEAYSCVRRMYDQINEMLFSSFNSNMCHKKD